MHFITNLGKSGCTAVQAGSVFREVSHSRCTIDFSASVSRIFDLQQRKQVSKRNPELESVGIRTSQIDNEKKSRFEVEAQARESLYDLLQDLYEVGTRIFRDLEASRDYTCSNI